MGPSVTEGDRVRRRLIAANWKMHKTIGEATGFVDELLLRIAGVESVDVVICPAYPALGPTAQLTRGSRAQVFARTCTTRRRDLSPAKCRCRCCSKRALAV